MCSPAKPWLLLIMLGCSSVLLAQDSMHGRHTSAIQQVRMGLFVHNLGLIASRVEHGMDVNIEFEFTSLEYLFSAKPTVGAMINTIGYTSYLYSGLAWDFHWEETDSQSGFFISPFLGVAVHDGKLQPEGDHRGLGCRFLFREAIDIGWRFNKDWALSIMTDHLSHGGLCENRNQGLDNSGIRLHWRF